MSAKRSTIHLVAPWSLTAALKEAAAREFKPVDRHLAAQFDRHPGRG
jgi:hypothetical protein